MAPGIPKIILEAGNQVKNVFKTHREKISFVHPGSQKPSQQLIHWEATKGHALAK